MDSAILVGIASVVSAGLTIAIGAISPALGEGKSVAQGLHAIAQQPDEAGTISRTLFVGLAMIESTAIYCFVVSMILIFANPFWNFMMIHAGKSGMDDVAWVGFISILIAGLTITVGSIGSALAEGRSVAQALDSLARQPDSAGPLTRTLFVGLAMMESPAIFSFVVSMLLIFTNPFWNYAISRIGG